MRLAAAVLACDRHTTGVCVSPFLQDTHAQAGLDILRDGGNAIEATIAVAATTLTVLGLAIRRR